MELWKIILGAFAAVFLVHVRGSYLRAQDQLGALTRLQSYLLYWRGWVLDNDIFSVFYFGVKWNEEIRDIHKKGEGAESLIKLKEEKKKKLDEIKEALSKGEPDINLEHVKARLKKFPDELVPYILKYGARIEQNLLDGKTFLSDSEAAVLGPYFSHTCVRLKMSMNSMNNKALGLILLLITNPEEFSLKKVSNEIAELFWSGVLVSKDIDELSWTVDGKQPISVLLLTWKNLCFARGI